MKNFSPRFGASFFAGSILFLAFSTSSFAVRGGRFPGDFEGPREETQRQELDREMTVNSSSAARSSAFSTASEPQAADPKHGAFVKELLAKTDGEIENHLINSEVRKKFLERKNYYQDQVASAAAEEHASNFLKQLSPLLRQLSKEMNNVVTNGDYSKFLKEIQSAELIYDFFEREKEQLSKPSVAAVSAMASSSAAAVEADVADPAALNHRRAAQSITSLVELHRNLATALNSSQSDQSDLITAYQKRLMLMQLAPKKIDLSRPEKEQAVTAQMFKLVDLALEASDRGQSSNLDSAIAVIKRQQEYLDNLRKNPTVVAPPFSMAQEAAQYLICQAEALALEHKVKQQVPSNERKPSQFVPALDPALAGTQEAALIKLNDQLFRVGLFRKADEVRKDLLTLLPQAMKTDPKVKDVIHTLMENRYGQMRQASRIGDQKKLLTEVKQTAFLYPYITKKVGLLKQMMGVALNAMPVEYYQKVSPLWDSMHPQWKTVMDSLDNLAVSRFLFEKKIAENPNDLYLMNALDEVRDRQEQAHGKLLLETQQEVSLPPLQTTSIRSSLNEMQRSTRSCLNFTYAISSVGFFSLAAYLFWLYTNNLS